MSTGLGTDTRTGVLGRLLGALAEELELLRRRYEAQADIITPLIARPGLPHSNQAIQAFQQHDLIMQEIEVIAGILRQLGKSDAMDASPTTVEARARLVDEILSTVKLGNTQERISRRLSGKFLTEPSSDKNDEMWD